MARVPRNLNKSLSISILAAISLNSQCLLAQPGMDGTQSGAADVANRNCAQNGCEKLTAATCLASYPVEKERCSISACKSIAELQCKGFTESADVPVEEDNSPPTGGDVASKPRPKSTPANDATKDPSGDPSRGDGGGRASGAQCQQVAQQAYSTCSSAGGSFSPSGGGINSLSGQLAGATGSAANANIQQGVECSNAIGRCEEACNSTDPGTANQCRSLYNRVRQAGEQAKSLNDNQTQSLNSGNQSAAYNNPEAQNCNINPNTPECRALTESKKYEKGDAGFNGSDQLQENFKVGSTTDGRPTQAFQGSGVGLDQIRNNATYGTIANNSGGSIPGSGGSGGALAGGGRGESPGAPGYTTDVLQGFQGASGAGGANVGTTKVDSSAGFKGYGNTARGPASQNFDLKKYLPGGSKQNTRNLGGFIPFSIEINGPHVNIWNRISDRFMEKCKLGELIDCR